jgi:hypothetical protein
MSVLDRIVHSSRAFVWVPILMSVPGLLNATITLRGLEPDEEYQQQLNSPCVIGDPSCQNPDGFLYTLLPAGDVGSYDEYSPEYTVGQLKELNLANFIVGFDVNEAGPIQEISLFEILIDGVVFDSFDEANTPVHPENNGNGFADFVFTGFPSLSGYDDDVTVQFHAVMPLVNDGQEEFFLIPIAGPPGDPGEIPEPATLALMGIGLAGVALFAKRRRSA